MSAPPPPPPPPMMMAAAPPPPAMPKNIPRPSNNNNNNNAPDRKDNSQLLREIERGVTLRKTPQSPTNAYSQQPWQPPTTGLLQPGANGADEFEPVKQQLQAELNSTLRRRQNGIHNNPGSKPHFVVPKNSTINAIYNQLNELDQQKAAVQETPIESTNPSPYYSSPNPTTANSNGGLFTSNATLPRPTATPNGQADEQKPKLMINHGKPNFVRPSVPTLRPKPLESVGVADRPESNDITRTIRGLKNVETSPEDEPFVTPKLAFETSPILLSKTRPVEVTQNPNHVFKNNLTNHTNNVIPITNNNNVIYNNTGTRNNPVSVRPSTNPTPVITGSPLTARKFPSPPRDSPASTTIRNHNVDLTNNVGSGSPFNERKFPSPPRVVPPPTQVKNNHQVNNDSKDLTNVIRKLQASDLTDDMQLSDETYLTHVRVQTGDNNNIVYVPQGLPFRMVLNSTPFPKTDAPTKQTPPNFSDKPQYLQKSHPVLNKPDALDYTSVGPRSPPTSSSTTPPDLSGQKSAGLNNIVNQMQQLRKVDLKGDGTWMNRNNHASPPATADAATPILAKEATPFQPSLFQHNPIITAQTIHHLHNSMMPNFDIRNMTSFSKDLMDAPNRFPDMAIFTSPAGGNPRRAAADANGGRNNNNINETTTTKTTTRTLPNGETKEDRFFSNVKFTIGENGDVRPIHTSITTSSH